MTYEGLGEMFEGDSADMCAKRIPLESVRFFRDDIHFPFIKLCMYFLKLYRMLIKSGELVFSHQVPSVSVIFKDDLFSI